MLPGAVGVIVILRAGLGVGVIRAVVPCSFGRHVRGPVAGQG